MQTIVQLCVFLFLPPKPRLVMLSKSIRVGSIHESLGNEWCLALMAEWQPLKAISCWRCPSYVIVWPPWEQAAGLDRPGHGLHSSVIFLYVDPWLLTATAWHSVAKCIAVLLFQAWKQPNPHVQEGQLATLFFYAYYTGISKIGRFTWERLVKAQGHLRCVSVSLCVWERLALFCLHNKSMQIPHLIPPLIWDGCSPKILYNSRFLLSRPLWETEIAFLVLKFITNW